jgi:hypothetical protein
MMTSSDPFSLLCLGVIAIAAISYLYGLFESTPERILDRHRREKADSKRRPRLSSFSREPTGMKKHVRRSKQYTRNRPQFWLQLDGPKFEEEVAFLLAQAGYRVERRGGSGDRGVDLLVRTPLGRKLVVQCKAWAQPAPPRVVRELLGSMVHERADGGVLAIPGGVTSAARPLFKQHPLHLLELRGLIELAVSRALDLEAPESGTNAFRRP